MNTVAVSPQLWMPWNYRAALTEEARTPTT